MRVSTHEIEFSLDLERRFLELAQKYQSSKEEWLEVLGFFERFLEDTEDYLMALERTKRIDSGEDKTISFEEVLKEVGLNFEDIESKSSSS